MIEVDHLSKYYGSTAAVRDITFSVDQGEILGFLGPNGAGKSTTMRIITGYLQASEGTVRVDGYDVAEDSLEVRRRIGYLPESVPLYTDMSVYDYLNYMGKLKEMNNANERKTRIWEVMEQVDIVDVGKRLIGQLSKGYRQRVGLAQALLHNPEVLILDEPTVGLDPRQIIGIRDLIKSLGQDHTVILSTHILPEVSMICSRVVIINRGRLVALDTPLHLAENVAGGATRLQLTVKGPRDNVSAALSALPGVSTVEPIVAQTGQGGADGVFAFELTSAAQQDLRAKVARAVVNNNWDLLELRPVTMNLEEIFLRATASEEPDEDYYPEDSFTPDAEAPTETADLYEQEGHVMGELRDGELVAVEDEDEGAEAAPAVRRPMRVRPRQQPKGPRQR